MESTVTVRGQTAIPVAIRRSNSIKQKTKLEWIDDGHTITVLPYSERPHSSASRKFKDADLLRSLLKSKKEVEALKIMMDTSALFAALGRGWQRHSREHLNSARKRERQAFYLSFTAFMELYYVTVEEKGSEDAAKELIILAKSLPVLQGRPK